MPERVESQVTRIEESVGELTGLTKELTDRQASQIRKLRRIAAATTAGMILDLLLSVFGVFLVVRTSNNSDRIDLLQSRTSTDALCPLYDLFLDSYDTRSASALADPKRYEESFVVIERGARALGCSHVTRGKD